jgi:hypothetical protein
MSHTATVRPGPMCERVWTPHLLSAVGTFLAEHRSLTEAGQLGRAEICHARRHAHWFQPLPAEPYRAAVPDYRSQIKLRKEL